MTDSIISPKQRSVSIIYGFSEGALTGRKLRKALGRAGYKVTRPENADIIIAHSGGYLVMPPQLRAHTVVYVGANTWDQPLPTALKQKLRFDYIDRKQKGQLLMWLLHGLRNDAYILKLTHTLRLARAYRTKPLQAPAAQHTIVIRNRHDSYCTEPALLTWQGMTTFISIEGGHDDIWDNPETYVDVIQSLYRE